MKAEKDKKTGKWLIQYRYTDWQGKRRKSTKRGFATKREAEEWLRNFLITQKADFDMKFADFWKMYCADMETRLREHTMRTKKYIVELKILPYFGNKRVNDITAADIRQWQNELIKMGYSPTYLKTINNQLSAIFNYAVRYYDLKSNPCVKAGSMGKSKAEEMDFWTGEEFRKFIDSVMNKRLSYMAFMTLYRTGMRMGELLALNPKDIDLEKRTISITKSYQRLGKKDVITPPKTPKSKRVITIPEFLAADIKDYMDSFLTDTGQQGIQRSNIFNMSFQTVLHTFNQIRLFQHDRRCAAILFAGRAVIIVILFVFIAVRLAGHTAATASADQNTGKQVNLIRFGRSPCVNPAEPLHQIKIVLLYDRFMGSLHTNPFRRRFVLTLF